MMKKVLFAGMALFVTIFSYGQTLLSSANCTTKLVIESFSGNNGVAVAYNPVSKTYYAIYAGNASFALETFRLNGEFVATQNAGFDSRGMWYNPRTKKLEGVTYDNQGTFSMELSSSGMIGQSTSNDFNYRQPSNAVMAYNPKKNRVLFVSETGVASIYKNGKAKARQTTLQLGTDPDNFNVNGPIFTAVKGKEIGLFNWQEKAVYFFDKKTGENTGKVLLQVASCSPEMEIPTYFCVSYSNNKVWLYDKESRTWFGFDIWSN